MAVAARRYMRLHEIPAFAPIGLVCDAAYCWGFLTGAIAREV
jgi:hypothetical protein